MNKPPFTGREITRTDYTKYTGEQWKGTLVVSTEILSTRLAKIPAGTGFRITDKFEGFGLESTPCECCGTQHRLRKVPPQVLKVVEDAPADLPALTELSEADTPRRESEEEYNSHPNFDTREHGSH